ncbi:hypothetical protein PAPYR_5206 [Paratrimastix pyriformis]|uniref:Uncharacterized protein n=1 Tax=Paratrimastix pyriformis TaxID=342808 RepID=A0ABQ8UI79_9EUKA|nr:hypothetical protein PAPYR_5206 [Paratrimastix pyriformis]
MMVSVPESLVEREKRHTGALRQLSGIKMVYAHHNRGTGTTSSSWASHRDTPPLFSRSARWGHLPRGKSRPGNLAAAGKDDVHPGGSAQNAHVHSTPSTRPRPRSAPGAIRMTVFPPQRPPALLQPKNENFTNRPMTGTAAMPPAAPPTSPTASASSRPHVVDLPTPSGPASLVV